MLTNGGLEQAVQRKPIIRRFLDGTGEVRGCVFVCVAQSHHVKCYDSYHQSAAIPMVKKSQAGYLYNTKKQLVN